jgi:hypothetical protein
MTVNVGKELAALRRMSVDDLRARYAKVFGKTTNGQHKEWLIKRISSGCRCWRKAAWTIARGQFTETTQFAL